MSSGSAQRTEIRDFCVFGFLGFHEFGFFECEALLLVARGLVFLVNAWYFFGDFLVELDDECEALFDEAEVLQQVAFADGLRAGDPVGFGLVALDFAEELLDEGAA